MPAIRKYILHERTSDNGETLVNCALPLCLYSPHKWVWSSLTPTFGLLLITQPWFSSLRFLYPADTTVVWTSNNTTVHITSDCYIVMMNFREWVRTHMVKTRGKAVELECLKKKYKTSRFLYAYITQGWILLWKGHGKKYSIWGCPWRGVST